MASGRAKWLVRSWQETFHRLSSIDTFLSPALFFGSPLVSSRGAGSHNQSIVTSERFILCDSYWNLWKHAVLFWPTNAMAKKRISPKAAAQDNISTLLVPPVLGQRATSWLTNHYFGEWMRSSQICTIGILKQPIEPGKQNDCSGTGAPLLTTAKLDLGSKDSKWQIFPCHVDSTGLTTTMHLEYCVSLCHSDLPTLFTSLSGEAWNVVKRLVHCSWDVTCWGLFSCGSWRRWATAKDPAPAWDPAWKQI